MICFFFRPELKKHIDRIQLLPLLLTGRIYFIWDEIHHTEQTVCILYQFLQMLNLVHYLHIGKRSRLPEDCPSQHSFLLVSATPEALRWHIHQMSHLKKEKDDSGDSTKPLALPSTSSEIPIFKGVEDPNSAYYGHYEQYKNDQYHSYDDDDIKKSLPQKSNV